MNIYNKYNNEKINDNTIIQVIDNDFCKKCNKKMELINVLMKFKSYGKDNWKNEKVYYCNICNKYYISQFKKQYFRNIYKNYAFIENEDNIKVVKGLECYILTGKHNHLICNATKSLIR